MQEQNQLKPCTLAPRQLPLHILTHKDPIGYGKHFSARRGSTLCLALRTYLVGTYDKKLSPSSPSWITASTRWASIAVSLCMRPKPTALRSQPYWTSSL